MEKPALGCLALGRLALGRLAKDERILAVSYAHVLYAA